MTESEKKFKLSVALKSLKQIFEIRVKKMSEVDMAFKLFLYFAFVNH